MEVTMALYCENEDEVRYLFGDPSSKSRGIMRIDKHDPYESEIITMPDDGSCDMRLAKRAIVKLIKMALDGEYPQKLGYCPGW